MNDNEIVALYWARAENAIAETARKYGSYCRYIAFHILDSHEDSEECVNDTYLRAWNCIPPHRPAALKTFLGKITRNLALDRYAQQTAQKRGGGQNARIFDEMRTCLPSPESPEEHIEALALTALLNRFLSSLTPEKRKIFLRRYWYFSSVKEIAAEYHISESKVKMSLLRTRNELKNLLTKEGISV